MIEIGTAVQLKGQPHRSGTVFAKSQLMPGAWWVRTPHGTEALRFEDQLEPLTVSDTAQDAGSDERT